MSSPSMDSPIVLGYRIRFAIRKCCWFRFASHSLVEYRCAHDDSWCVPLARPTTSKCLSANRTDKQLWRICEYGKSMYDHQSQQQLTPTTTTTKQTSVSMVTSPWSCSCSRRSTGSSNTKSFSFGATSACLSATSPALWTVTLDAVE